MQTKLSYGMQSYYVGRKLFARMLDDGDSVVIKIEPEYREVLTKANPERSSSPITTAIIR